MRGVTYCGSLRCTTQGERSPPLNPDAIAKSYEFFQKCSVYIQMYLEMDLCMCTSLFITFSSDECSVLTSFSHFDDLFVLVMGCILFHSMGAILIL